MNINFWQKGSITRFYIKDESNDDLGFFEEVEIDKENVIYGLKAIGVSPETERYIFENLSKAGKLDSADLKSVASGVHKLVGSKLILQKGTYF